MINYKLIRALFCDNHKEETKNSKTESVPEVEFEPTVLVLKTEKNKFFIKGREVIVVSKTTNSIGEQIWVNSYIERSSFNTQSEDTQVYDIIKTLYKLKCCIST